MSQSKELPVIDKLLDELQRAGVFGRATIAGVYYPNYFKENARPIIAKYLAAPSAPVVDKLDSSSAVGWYECELLFPGFDCDRRARWWDGECLRFQPGGEGCSGVEYCGFRLLVHASLLTASRAGQGDEGEAISEEWLRSIGFEVEHLEDYESDALFRAEIGDTAQEPETYSLAVFGDGTASIAYSDIFIPCKTRGDVRRLMKALHILSASPIEEPGT